MKLFFYNLVERFFNWLEKQLDELEMLAPVDVVLDYGVIAPPPETAPEAAWPKVYKAEFLPAEEHCDICEGVCKVEDDIQNLYPKTVSKKVRKVAKKKVKAPLKKKTLKRKK